MVCSVYDHGLHWSNQNLHNLAGISSLDILYLEGKSPLLMRNIQVNFGDILPETSKSSAFWDMGVNSNIKWLYGKPIKIVALVQS